MINLKYVFYTIHWNSKNVKYNYLCISSYAENKKNILENCYIIFPNKLFIACAISVINFERRITFSNIVLLWGIKNTRESFLKKSFKAKIEKNFNIRVKQN